jgi:peptidyl-prolyl cis-trans isomerase D
MSLLESFRKGSDSTTTRLIVGVVAAIFIFWGVGNTSGQGTAIYASVGGTDITDTEFRREYQMRARQLQGNLSKEDEQAFASAVLEDMIAREAILQEAGRLGIRVGDEEVARALVQIPAFQSAEGKFDQPMYEKTLKQMNLSPGLFEGQLRQQMLAERVLDVARRGVTVPDASVREAYLRENTTMRLKVVRLPLRSFVDDGSVSDAERAAVIASSADEVKARYDRDFARLYDLPDRWTLSSILLKTDIPGVPEADVAARAEKIRADAAEGADFAALARRWSEDLAAANGGNLGRQAEAQIDADLVAAARAAGVGKVAAVTKTARGLQIIKVEAFDPKETIAFERARDEIAAGIVRERRAQAAMDAATAEILAAWKAEGAPPPSVIDARGLVVDVTEDFPVVDAAEELPIVGKVEALAPLLASATKGQVFDQPFDVRGTRTLIGVEDRADADMAQYEVGSTLVRARLLMMAQRDYLAAWRDDLVTNRTEVWRNPDVFGTAAKK